MPEPWTGTSETLRELGKCLIKIVGGDWSPAVTNPLPLDIVTSTGGITKYGKSKLLFLYQVFVFVVNFNLMSTLSSDVCVVSFKILRILELCHVFVLQFMIVAD